VFLKTMSRRGKQETQERFQWPSPKRDLPKMESKCEVSYETSDKLGISKGQTAIC